MSSSYDINDNEFEVKNDWFGTVRNQSVNPFTDEPYDFCEYCRYNFNVYNECINNVCQSCGRAADFMKKSRQDTLKATSLNNPENKNFVKGTSLTFDYSPLTMEGDQQIARNKMIRDGGEIMTSNFGPGHAMQLIREAEEQASIRSRLRDLQPYRLKTTYKEKTVRLDDEKE